MTPWTVAHQAHLFMRFPRQESWSELSFPSSGIFTTQGSSLGLLYCRQTHYWLNHQRSPNKSYNFAKETYHIKLTYQVKKTKCRIVGIQVNVIRYSNTFNNNDNFEAVMSGNNDLRYLQNLILIYFWLLLLTNIMLLLFIAYLWKKQYISVRS